MQEGLNGSILRNCHGESRWRETGLGHPARNHGAGEFTLSRGENAERPHDPTQGQHRRVTAAFTEPASATALLFALLSMQLATEPGAGFFEGSNLRCVGAELHPDGIERKVKTAVTKLVLQQVDGLTAPSKAAKHAHGFTAVSFGEERPQGGDDRRWCMSTERW